jgi:hypothetical protein
MLKHPFDPDIVTVDTIGSVRWDKVDPFTFDHPDLEDVYAERVRDVVDAFCEDVNFQREFNMDENARIYASYKKRGKYDVKKVTQNLMRILNVYRKKKGINIYTLDELKIAAIQLEEIINAAI